MRVRFNAVSRRVLSIFDNKSVFPHLSCANYVHRDIESQNVSLNELYVMTKNKYESKKLPADVNPRGVFACNELDLKEVKVYGFDYDYTLAVYKPSLDSHLYNLGMDCLVTKFKTSLAVVRNQRTTVGFPSSLALAAKQQDVKLNK